MQLPVIKNIDEIAVTPLRKDALDILEAGYEAILTPKVIRERVTLKDNILSVDEHQFNLSLYDRIFFVGIGKCAADAAKVIENILGDRIIDGLVIDVRGVPLRHMKSVVGTHPLPSKANVEAAREVAVMLKKTTEKDLVITVISGGGSALLCLPADMECEQISTITQALMDNGATISEINTVRKHMSKIQGGQFAKLAYPSTVCALVFSDVPGDYISIIASGPTVLDGTTKEDARAIIEKYHIQQLCNMPECNLIETPKEEKYFSKVTNILFITNKVALRAMREKAGSLGYTARIVTTNIQGEAREVGKQLAQDAARNSGECLLYGGETTVTTRGKGSGGRNQEVVLAGLPHLGSDTVLVAAASDGWDNTPAAGAIGDHALYEESREQNLNPIEFLDNNDSYNFFMLTHGHIKTEKTGTNVSDFYFTITAE